MLSGTGDKIVSITIPDAVPVCRFSKIQIEQSA
jgi:hypothetical protein